MNGGNTYISLPILELVCVSNTILYHCHCYLIKTCTASSLNYSYNYKHVGVPLHFVNFICLLKEMTAITVRPRAMFSAILSKICLSDAKYARCRNYNRRVGATVVFWPSMLHFSEWQNPGRSKTIQLGIFQQVNE